MQLALRAFVLVLGLLTAVSASAGDTDWYRIEIVVFANTQAGAGGSEAWPTDISDPSTQNAQQLAPPGSGGAYSMLANSELKLGGVVSELRSSGVRKPILHIGWRQPVLERGKARPVWIQGGPQQYRADGRAMPEISGTLLLTRSRFLHVWTDLMYLEPGSQGVPFHMKDHRRMRSGEIHYIDHPMFGMIILCTPIRTAD